jgi:hypothetical protein
MNGDRPVTVAINPRLIEELKIRKETIEKETERKAKGGITCFSELAALELKSIRQSGDKIFKEILKIKKVPVKKIIERGVDREYVPYEIFKKLLILSSALNRKKDQKQIKLEITKIRGIKKNEIKFLWD